MVFSRCASLSIQIREKAEEEPVLLVYKQTLLLESAGSGVRESWSPYYIL